MGSSVVRRKVIHLGRAMVMVLSVLPWECPPVIPRCFLGWVIVTYLGLSALMGSWPTHDHIMSPCSGHTPNQSPLPYCGPLSHSFQLTVPFCAMDTHPSLIMLPHKTRFPLQIFKIGSTDDGGWERAQSIQHSLCKHEDLSSTARAHMKSLVMVINVFNPVAEQVEMGGSWSSLLPPT